MLRLTETKHEVMRIGVMAAQQTLTPVSYTHLKSGKSVFSEAGRKKEQLHDSGDRWRRKI